MAVISNRFADNLGIWAWSSIRVSLKSNIRHDRSYDFPGGSDGKESACFGRVTLKHVEYHVRNELPVQVRSAILDAWGWCTGTTQRDGVGREEGGGFRMGNTCMPVADSF